MEILLKRIYEDYRPEDGYRVLVDRIWPRGISKEEAHLDEWEKDTAPSTELRKWFHHDPVLWNEFTGKYLAELNANPAVKPFADRLKKQERVTFLFAEKDEQHCHPVILKKYVEQLLKNE